MSRTVQYAESTGESTTTNTSYQDKVSLDVGGEAGDWIIFWSAMVKKNSTTTDIKVRLENTSDTQTETELNFEAKDTTDYQTVQGATKLTTVDATTKNFKIQYCSESSGTVSIKEARIVAIKMAAADQYVENDSQVDAVNGGTRETAATLTFTPDSVGDYLIFWFGETTYNGGSSFQRAHFVVDGSDNLWPINYSSTIDTTSYLPVVKAKVHNLTAAEHTILLDVLSNGGTGTVSMRRSRIIALRLDEWPDYSYNYDRSHTTTSSTPVTGNTLTKTTPAGDHLIFDNRVWSFGNLSVTTSSIEFNTLVDSGTLFPQASLEPLSTSEDRGYFMFKKETLTAAEHVYEQQVASENGTNTARSDDQTLALLQIESSGTEYDETYSETITLVDTLGKSQSRILNEAVTVVDSIIKAGSRAFSEAITLVDTFIGARLRSTELTEEIDIVDTVQKSQSRTLTEAIPIVDTIIRSSSRLFTETVTIVDTVLKNTARTLSEAVPIADLVTGAKVTLKELSETVTIQDSIVRTISKLNSEVITIVDTLNRSIARTLTQSITIVDTILKTPSKVLSETVTVVDSIVRSTTKTLTQVITVVDAILRVPNRSFTENITITDVLQKTSSRILSEVVTIVDTVVGTANIVYERTFSEVVTVTDTLVKTIMRTFTENISIHDTFIKFTNWFNRTSTSWYNKAGGWYTKLANSWKQTLEE